MICFDDHAKLQFTIWMEKMVYAMLQFTILETMPPDDNCRKHVDPAIHTFFFHKSSQTRPSTRI